MKNLVLTTCLVFAVASCASPQCKELVTYVVDGAMLLCEAAADAKTGKERDNKSPKEWCSVAENFAPYFEQYIQGHCEETEGEPSE